MILANFFVRLPRHNPPPRTFRNETSLFYLWLNVVFRARGLRANPFARLTRQKQARAEPRATRGTAGRVAISSSADSLPLTGHGNTRIRECDHHLKLDRSLVKRPLHLYLAEPPCFTPVETPIDAVSEPVAEFILQ
ncbi:hypothetical protein V8E51_004690 [Hyaloscypha variabilis]